MPIGCGRTDLREAIFHPPYLGSVASGGKGWNTHWLRAKPRRARARQRPADRLAERNIGVERGQFGFGLGDQGGAFGRVLRRGCFGRAGVSASLEHKPAAEGRNGTD